MGEYFLGVDGGQSSTTAWIGDGGGQLIGRGTAGPCNHVGAVEGRAKFTSALNGCIGKACAEAKLDPSTVSFEAACLGFSGGPADKEALVREMVRVKQLLVSHDALIALVGATGGEPGVIVIAGTGSIAFGRNAAGRTARAGGWGYVFGDEAGAFDLVRQALRAALRYEEGWGPPTTLYRRLLEATGAANANELLHQFYTDEYPRSRVATYARLLSEAADEGDTVALELLRRAGQQLASLVAAVRDQLFAAGEVARVSYIGGVFKNQYVLERFRTLVELEEGNRCEPPLHGPAAGALIEAYRIGGQIVRLESDEPGN